VVPPKYLRRATSSSKYGSPIVLASYICCDSSLHSSPPASTRATFFPSALNLSAIVIPAAPAPIIVASYPEVFLNHPDVHRVYRVGLTAYFYDDYILGKDTVVFRQEPYFQSGHIMRKKHLVENWADIGAPVRVERVNWAPG